MDYDDRDAHVRTMMDEFLTPDALAALAAEELATAMQTHGILARDVVGDDDGVNVALGGLRDAETLLSITMTQAGPGTLYDRATSSCQTLTALTQEADATGIEPSEEQVAEAFRSGWQWMMHPEMRGRVVGWHTTVIIPPEDAMALASILNEIRNGGAL